jgi:hypothetical protein
MADSSSLAQGFALAGIPVHPGFFEPSVETDLPFLTERQAIQ